MKQDYTMPINISVVFENAPSRIWTSSTLTPNHYLNLIPATWFYGLNCFFKKEVFFAQSFLVEHSIIDTKHYSCQSNFFNDFFKNSYFVYFYVYYFYHLKTKISIFVLPSLFDKVYSVESIYPNSNWLERESAEMYGVYFLGKKDHRKLLLDYSKTDSPMLKDFSTEGVSDFYFNFFEEQVCFTKSEVVEL